MSSVLAAGAVTISAGLVRSPSRSCSAQGLFRSPWIQWPWILQPWLHRITDAVASVLKSPGAGGGTLAGSGRGTAASIASSAALARGVSDWAARAEVAETARKVAATAIKTRSNPARLVEQSRIVTPLGRNCPGMEQSSGIVGHSLRASAGFCRFSRRYACTQRVNADDTCAPVMQPAPCGATHDKLTSNYPLLWVARFCHAARPLSVTGKQRFKGSRITHAFDSPRSLPPERHNCARFNSRLARRLRPRRWRQPRRVCDRVWSGRSSTGARPPTSVRDNAKWRSG